MSPNPPGFSIAEIDGRLSALKAQRDQALDIIVIQAGEIAKLREQLATLKGPSLTSETVGGYAPVAE